MIHITPLFDLWEHTHEVGCLCNPRLEVDQELIVHHRSFDNREQVEARGGRGLPWLTEHLPWE